MKMNKWHFHYKNGEWRIYRSRVSATHVISAGSIDHAWVGLHKYLDYWGWSKGLEFTKKA